MFQNRCNWLYIILVKTTWFRLPKLLGELLIAKVVTVHKNWSISQIRSSKTSALSILQASTNILQTIHYHHSTSQPYYHYRYRFLVQIIALHQQSPAVELNNKLSGIYDWGLEMAHHWHNFLPSYFLTGLLIPD